MAYWWNVYNEGGTLVGKLKDPEIAAAVVSLHGSGSTVRYNRRVVWTETEENSAGESYDAAAVEMMRLTDEWKHFITDS